MPSEPLGYVMLVRDLTTTRAEAEETLESERLNALTLLAAGVAHEIGNPLNSLDIHLQLLGRKLRKLPPGDRETAGGKPGHRARGNPAAGHASSSSSSTPSARRRRTASGRTCTRCCTKRCSCWSRNWRRGKSPWSSISRSRMPPAMVDPGQFQQVFYNLIRNAYQAICPRRRAGSPSAPGRTISSPSSPSRTTAPAFPPSTWERSSSPTAPRNPPAPGLGLLIVRRIIREHGGEIAIESEENQGTRVLIHLPHAERRVRLLGAPEADPVIDL